MIVLPLESVSDHNRSLVGGKALALATLMRSGERVPVSVVVTTEAYRRYLEEQRLGERLLMELGRKRFSDMRWEELWDASLRIRNLFLRTPLPQELAQEIRQAVEDLLGDQQLAVRSSAPGEDEKDSSFAGLHESFVGVQGWEAVLEKVRLVWASLWSDRALLYRQDLGLSVRHSAMAVLVQQLVEGETSGVVFGLDPVDPSRSVVEAVYGLNQGLVDGRVQPDRWFLQRHSGMVLEHVAPEQRQRMVRARGSLAVERVPASLAAGPPLNESKLGRVFSLVQSLEQLFGGPQDVEWTLAQDVLWTLQSRPITGIAGSDDERGWYLSLHRSFHQLESLWHKVEKDHLPSMAAEAEALAEVAVESLSDRDLAAEIQSRQQRYDRWVDIYTREFIPLAHGARLFGQVYNDLVQPQDPSEFLELLAGTAMTGLERNRALESLAEMVRGDRTLGAELDAGLAATSSPAFEDGVRQFVVRFGAAAYGEDRCLVDRQAVVSLVRELARCPPRSTPDRRSDLAEMEQRLLSRAPQDNRSWVEDLLKLARASYRLRDDDNLYLGRIKSEVLRAVEEGRRRVDSQGTPGEDAHELRRVVPELRDPNLVRESSPHPFPAEEAGFQVQARQLRGQPAGPGFAVGKARVVRSGSDLSAFRNGEILVCDAIDPNMTFIVPLAAGVVERRGGMLIHGAIIAREYGLPCVTGVPEATSRIATGQRVTLDGYLGIVIMG